MMGYPLARYVSPAYMRQVRLAWFAIGLTAGVFVSSLLLGYATP